MTQVQQQTELSERCSWVEPVYVEGSELDADEWLKMATILKKASETSPTCHLATILKNILKRDAQLWALVDKNNFVVGGLVTQILEHKTSYTTLDIVLCATEDTNVEWQSMRNVLSRLEEVALSMDCDAVRIEGRKGWGKMFPDYTQVYCVFDKVLKRGD